MPFWRWTRGGSQEKLAEREDRPEAVNFSGLPVGTIKKHQNIKIFFLKRTMKAISLYFFYEMKVICPVSHDTPLCVVSVSYVRISDKLDIQVLARDHLQGR